MKTSLVAVLLAASATLASVAAPAFASNYGPAPFYRPSVSDTRPVPQPAARADAPATTMASDDENDSSDSNNAQQAYGGVSAGSSQADTRRNLTLTPWQHGLFAHH
ncbi:hypothetical protein [Paraburkholderia solisilvae]|uniref:Uncharacterized protein n=1 Tax=Paraburkholderia solisilvae TaxID=624376 RepID=A0A6J5EXI9_9BURK|nr:hypothetical protein [Paraburkholderia solisilvae]CAB3769836.1 hypothetical protein LMG29739_05638 [Paraburkholderia solisilvae]